VKSILYLGCPIAERADTARHLAAANVSVVWADNTAAALKELQRRDIPVLVDLSQGLQALEAARDIRSQRTSRLMFAVVDARRPDLTKEAVLAGMADVFARPLGGRRVAAAIERELVCASARSGAAAEIKSHDLYGQSAAMHDVLALITRAATMRAGVVLRGEEGTGRQVAARVIHDAQFSAGTQVASGMFVSVDCGAYDPEQLEAELFGAVAQSQHGGPRGIEHISRASRVCEASGGTLYLENVVEATARVQARLARVLHDREAVLVETGETAEIDVRPMAGVDPSVDHAVTEGLIREDLYRRLSVIRIDMPPLRSRREDIPALANYLLRDICASVRVPPKTLSRSALALIAALPWRGNARELRTVLESVVVGLQGTPVIGLEDVLAHLRLDGGAVVFARGGTLRHAKAQFERDYIAAVLAQHRGRVSAAARALGVQRTNLYRKMRALRVDHAHKQ
jgi:two-component system, NtrC family, nitrogen regulation response regulator NtrX